MKDSKVQIWTILASEQVELTKIQKKLNQWMTTGILIKYEMHTTATHIIFNVLIRKDA